MHMTRFTIETTYDLPSQPGLVIPGKIRSGAVRAGMVLRVEGTDQDVRILGVELSCSARSGTTQVALILDREHAQLLRPGTALVGPD